MDSLAPWLRNIQARAPGCPVIIVATHWDEIDAHDRQSRLDGLRRDVEKLRTESGMPTILGTVWVSWHCPFTVYLLTSDVKR